ncbi:MAG: glycosyltransferase family protein, partial [Candidatus Thermoplasmatota archaeon]|nr:glycosyltransferase family protein [Candidatus Thermoplasmatota archaeon]
RQRLKLLPIKILCRIFAPSPQLSLVSKGFNLRPNKPTAHILGPMLRPEIVPGAWKPTDTHVIAYLRTSVLQHLPAIAEHAKSHGFSLKLYGHYPQNVPDNVEIRPISNDGFIQDLLTANWIVQTAGTQLLGEVGTISIPSMCIPEPGQVEQEINAILAEKTLPNVNVLHPKSTSIQDLNSVLEKCRKGAVIPTIKNGQTQAVAIVDDFLNGFESQTTSSNQKQELALHTTHEQVSVN